MVVPLSSLKPGGRGRVVRVGTGGPLLRRMLDMGVTPGSTIEVRRFAPLGDPMEIRVKGYHLALRLAEASAIDIDIAPATE